VAESKESKQSSGNSQVKGSEKGQAKNFLAMLHEKNIVLYLLVLSFLAFLLTKSILFAVLTGASIIFLFVLDILVGVQHHGISKELIEVGIAAVFALAVWFGLTFALNTSSPISAIVSCSMLPAYERGDMILLQGVPMSEIKAPEIQVSQDILDSVVRSTHVPCGSTQFGIDYICSNCIRTDNNKQERYIQCAKVITVAGQLVNENLSNDVIVYTPQPTISKFQGDIIHRAYVKLTAGNRTVLLTKGDNNNYFDSSMFGAVPKENVKGKVLLRIPYLGYLKLFISGYFSEPEGCDTVLQH